MILVVLGALALFLSYPPFPLPFLSFFAITPVVILIRQAVREVGVIKGTILAVWRVVRCDPWSPGGVDELADRRLFRDAGHGHSAPEKGAHA